MCMIKIKEFLVKIIVKFSLIPHFNLGIGLLAVPNPMVQQQLGPALFYFMRCAARSHRLKYWGEIPGRNDICGTALFADIGSNAIR